MEAASLYGRVYGYTPPPDAMPNRYQGLDFINNGGHPFWSIHNVTGLFMINIKGFVTLGLLKETRTATIQSRGPVNSPLGTSFLQGQVTTRSGPEWEPRISSRPHLTCLSLMLALGREI